MPTYSTPVAKVTRANPGVDGRIVKHGLEFEYQFRPPSGDGEEGTWSKYTNAEYIPKVNCFRPRGYVPDVHMDLGNGGNWTVTDSAYWRHVRPSVFPSRVQFLEYFDSRPDQRGSVQSTGALDVNCAMHIIRNAPPENSTNERYLWVTWVNEQQHDKDPYPQWTFIFPVASSTQMRPQIWRTGAYTTGTAIHVATCPLDCDVSEAQGLELDSIRWEWIEKSWVIRRPGWSEPWIYTPPAMTEVTLEGGYTLQWPTEIKPGTVKISSIGHGCAFWFGELEYPASATVAVDVPMEYDEDFWSGTRTWATYGWNPWSSVWTVAGSEVAGTGDKFSPTVTFTRGAILGAPTNVAPAVYALRGRAPAEYDAGEAGTELLSIDSASYTVNIDGRGQTCELMVRDATGTKTFRGNDRITLELGYNVDTNPVTYATKFIGYVQDLERSRDGTQQIGATYLRLDCADTIEARLSKKYMVQRGSAQGYDLALWMYRVLWDAEVGETPLTDIATLASAGTVTIPGGTITGDLQWLFSEDICVVDAIEQVVAACGYEWGYNAATGKFFLRPPHAYTGTPDWTLDDDTTTSADFVWHLEHRQSPEDYRNYLYVISNLGGKVRSVIWPDTNAHRNASNSNYIGQSWWEVLTVTDAADGTPSAYRRWYELTRKHSCISWTMKGRTDLGPGKYVKVQVSKANLTTDAIYEIVEERGEVTGGMSDLHWRQTFVARFIQ